MNLYVGFKVRLYTYLIQYNNQTRQQLQENFCDIFTKSMNKQADMLTTH